MPTLRAQPPKHSHAGDFEIQFCAMGGRVSQNARKRVLKLSPIRLKRPWTGAIFCQIATHPTSFTYSNASYGLNLVVIFAAGHSHDFRQQQQCHRHLPSPFKHKQCKVFRIPHANYAVMGGSDCNRELLTWTAWPIHAKITHERTPHSE